MNTEQKNEKNALESQAILFVNENEATEQDSGLEVVETEDGSLSITGVRRC